MIDVRELIKNLTQEELRHSAEAYFALIKDPTYLLAKPFSNIDECPTLLMHFAKMIQCGSFVSGQSVLEFGAGSCWAGRFLNQLGLEVVSLDISPSALKLGMHLKNTWKVFGNQPGHTFLEFDGAHIDLPDGSIDRIVCFDCFHHVANPEQVLREFFRVLKPNGLVAFSEPGRFHSIGAQSQEEMKNYRVIENDIIVEEIWGMGKAIGYSNIFFSLTSIEPVMLDFSDYQSFQKDGISAQTLNEIKQNTEDHHVNQTLFFLRKGETEDADSRARPGLIAEIVLTNQLEHRSESGQKELQLTFTVKNLSKKTWLQSGHGLGNVNLGAHLFDDQGQMLDHDFYRYHFLVEDCHPETSVTFSCSIPWPSDLENFVLEFDLVSEQICWFAFNGSKTEKLTIAPKID